MKFSTLLRNKAAFLVTLATWTFFARFWRIASWIIWVSLVLDLLGNVVIFWTLTFMSAWIRGDYFRLVGSIFGVFFAVSRALYL